MAIILQGKVTALPMPATGYPDIVMFCGYALFWTGVSVGISNLVCGYDLFNIKNLQYLRRCIRKWMCYR